MRVHHYEPASDAGLTACMTWVDRHEGWALDVSFAAQAGSPVIRSIAVRPFDPEATPHGGVTRNLIDDIRMSQLYKALANADSIVQARGFASMSIDARDIPARYGEVRRPGRAGRSDLYYARWAALYLKNAESRDGRGVYAQMAQSYPKRGLSQAQRQREIRSAVEGARRRDILLGAQHGKVGGYLSERAEQLLREDHE